MDASTNNIGYYSITQDENERYIQKKVIKNLFSVGNKVNDKDYCLWNANFIQEIFKSNGYYTKLKYNVEDIKESFEDFLDEANYSSLYVEFIFYFSGEGQFNDGQISIKDYNGNDFISLDELIDKFENKQKQLKPKSYKFLIILDIFNENNNNNIKEKFEILVNLYNNNKLFSLNKIRKGCAVLCSPIIKSYPILNEVSTISTKNYNDTIKKLKLKIDPKEIKILSFTKFLIERLTSGNSPGRMIIKTSKVLSEHIVDDFIQQTSYQYSSSNEIIDFSNNNYINNTILSSSSSSPSSSISHQPQPQPQPQQQQILESLDLFDILKLKLGLPITNTNDAKFIKDITKILGSNYVSLFGDIVISDFILIPLEKSQRLKQKQQQQNNQQQIRDSIDKLKEIEKNQSNNEISNEELNLKIKDILKELKIININNKNQQ